MTTAERKAKGLTLARKEHRCELCFQKILPGELYGSYKVGPWNGCDEAQTIRHCRFCDDIWDKETHDWTRSDYEDCTCPSDVLSEAIHKRHIEWGIKDELDTIREWERMTKAARERWEEQGRAAPLWVHEWIDTPRPDFNKVSSS